MDIHLRREGRQLEPRSLDVVIAEVRNGDLDLDQDLAWIDGMGGQWETLGFVLELFCLPNREIPPFTVHEIFSPQPGATLEEQVSSEVLSLAPEITVEEPVETQDAPPANTLSWLMPAFCATLLGLLAAMAFVFFPYEEMDRAYEVIEGFKKHPNDAKALTEAVWTTFLAQASLCAFLWALMGFAAVPLASVFRLQNRGWGPVTLYVAVTFALTVGCHYWRYLEGAEIIRLVPDISGDHAIRTSKMLFLQSLGRLLLTWLAEPALSLLAAFTIFRRPAMWVVIFWFMAGFVNTVFYAIICIACGIPDLTHGFEAFKKGP